MSARPVVADNNGETGCDNDYDTAVGMSHAKKSNYLVATATTTSNSSRCSAAVESQQRGEVRSRNEWAEVKAGGETKTVCSHTKNEDDADIDNSQLAIARRALLRRRRIGQDARSRRNKNVTRQLSAEDNTQATTAASEATTTTSTSAVANDTDLHDDDGDNPKKADLLTSTKNKESMPQPSSSSSPSSSPSPKKQPGTLAQQYKSIDDFGLLLQSRIGSVLSLLRTYQKTARCHNDNPCTRSNDDKQNLKLETEVRELLTRIYAAQSARREIHSHDGHDKSSRDRRKRSSLVVGDNELIREMNSIVQDDPTITSFEVPHGDVRVGHLSRAFIIDRFVENGLRSNLFLRRLSMTGVSLNNEFLGTLGFALSTNIALQEITLSDNQFLADGIVEFLRIVGTSNDTCQVIDLRRQRSPVCFKRQQDSILEALEQNRSLVEVYVDFEATGFPKETSFDAQEQLDIILRRNQLHLKWPMASDNCTQCHDWDIKLIEFLRNQTEFMECMCEDLAFDDPFNFDWDIIEGDETSENVDWEYMYKLSELFDTNRTRDIIATPIAETNASSTLKCPFLNPRSFHFERSLQDANLAASLTPDGSFLTDNFITKYLKEDEDIIGRLVFNFCGQSFVFKRFTIGDPSRNLIVSKFVDAILSHPRANDITGINMANSCVGSDFFVYLADRCIGNPSMLPKLNSLNVETNYLGESGIIAICRCIANPSTWKYLQVVKLENQKSLLSSRAELALARAVTLNKSIVSVSLRVRNLHEKRVVDREVSAHLDLLRQARQRQMAENGISSPRRRSELELLFDKIAANDSSINEVKIVADRQFLSMSHKEKIKAACALKNNKHVTSLTLNALGLDDEFALKLAESLGKNTTLQKLDLDNNSFSGSGIIALFRAVSNHPKLTEIQIRHQSKVLASVEESGIPNLLQDNTSLIKVGVDLRSKHTEMLLDRKLSSNRLFRRSKKCENVN